MLTIETPALTHQKVMEHLNKSKFPINTGLIVLKAMLASLWSLYTYGYPNMKECSRPALRLEVCLYIVCKSHHLLTGRASGGVSI